MAEEPKIEVTVTSPEPDTPTPPSVEPTSRESELLEKLFEARMDAMKEELWNAVYDRGSSEWNIHERIDELEARVDAVAAFVIEEVEEEAPTPVAVAVTTIEPITPPVNEDKGKEKEEKKDKGAGPLW